MKNIEEALRKKLINDGINKEWLDTHLIVDVVSLLDIKNAEEVKDNE